MRVTRQLALVALLVLVAAGCTGDGEPEARPTTSSAGPPPATTTTAPQTTTETETEPVALVRMPPRALRECRRLRALRPACPTLVPEAPYDPASPVYVARSRRGIPYQAARGFELQWGAEHPGEPELDRPPATVHLVVSEFCCLLLDMRRERVRDGLLEERRRVPVSLGRVRWAGKRGDLVLAPPFPRGGIEANHLRFTWEEGGTVYGVSLHGWEPFTEVRPVLRAVVESIPG